MKSISLILCSRALATLDQTRKDAIIIKDVITETRHNLEIATVKSAELLKLLTSKATSLEKLKAKLGIGSSTLSAFTALIDNEIEEDDTTLLYDDEEDELDEEFEKIKNAKMKSRKIKVMEHIATAEVSLQEAKVQLRKAEQLVSITNTSLPFDRPTGRRLNRRDKRERERDPLGGCTYKHIPCICLCSSIVLAYYLHNYLLPFPNRSNDGITKWIVLL